MPLFARSSIYAEIIGMATSPANTTENWQKIMEVCDLIVAQGQVEDAVNQMKLRLTDKNPNVQRQAIKLISACCSNCGKTFHVAICSRDFTSSIKGLLSPKNPTHPTVEKELKEMLLELETMFGNDPQLSLIKLSISELKAVGTDFNVAPPVTTVAKSAETEAAEREQEELELALAASLSLSEVPGSSSQSSSVPMPKQHGDLLKSRPAKCLYDFEATEDNELSFSAGDVIVVTDNSDANWWSGHNQEGRQGYFPASFVSYDLNTQIESEVREPSPPPVVIDEEKLDQCLDLLYDAMQETTPEKLATIEKLVGECVQMGPLIDAQISAFDQAGSKLTDLNNRFESAVHVFQQLKTAKPLPAAAGGVGRGPSRPANPQAFFGQHPTAYVQGQQQYMTPPPSASNMYHPPMSSGDPQQVNFQRPPQPAQPAAGMPSMHQQRQPVGALPPGIHPNQPPPQNHHPKQVAPHAMNGMGHPGNQPQFHQNIPQQQQQQQQQQQPHPPIQQNQYQMSQMGMQQQPPQPPQPQHQHQHQHQQRQQQQQYGAYRA